MKKKIIFALLVVLGLFLCASASAQTFTFDAIHATCEVSDDYILLTPENLAEHPEWVANQGTTVEELLAQWAEEGVLLEAWDTKGDARLRISAIQDLSLIHISPQGRERGAKPFHALIIGLGKAYGYDIHPRHRQQA